VANAKSFLLSNLPSVHFRVILWQMLYSSVNSSFREIPCPSVANASAASIFFRVSASVFSVKFRVLPWQMLSLGFFLGLRLRLFHARQTT
jgi:hypothetical protein